MSNVASVLKQEIRKGARKEINEQTGVLRRSSAQHRRDIAELKRLVADLSRRLNFVEKQERRRVGEKPSEALAERARFSPAWLKAHRKKLGLSAADYAKLAGVSMLTIYNWEAGKSKPRQKQLAALVALRGLGKREAQRRLELL